MTGLDGKTALITGGSTGIGLATARLLQQRGARVVITGQDAARLKQAAETLGDDVLTLRADVSDRQEMAAAAARVGQELGRLDVLFANAGVAKLMPFGELDQLNIDQQIDVNFTGVVYTLHSMLPLLANPSSVILNATSLVEQGAPGMSIYAASKAAVRSLARSLSAELVEHGIRVNAVSPGPIETPIYGKLGMPGEQVQQLAGQILEKVPAGRFGTAEEVAELVCFLASDGSSYIRGEDIRIDGGMATL